MPASRLNNHDRFLAAVPPARRAQDLRELYRCVFTRAFFAGFSLLIRAGRVFTVKVKAGAHLPPPPPHPWKQQVTSVRSAREIVLGPRFSLFTIWRYPRYPAENTNKTDEYWERNKLCLNRVHIALTLRGHIFYELRQTKIARAGKFKVPSWRFYKEWKTKGCLLACVRTDGGKHQVVAAINNFLGRKNLAWEREKLCGLFCG